MTEDSITVQVLKDIRSELRELKATTDSRLETINGRLETLDKRQLATEIRLATELTAVVGAIHELRDVLIEDRKLRT